MLRPALLCLLAAAAVTGVHSSCRVMSVVDKWELGFSMNVNLTFPVEAQSWSAALEFDTTLANLETWADQLSTADNRTYTVSNNMWDGGHRAGDLVTLFFVVDFRSRYDPAQLISVQFFGAELC